MTTSFQAIVKPEMIVWARKTSGLDQHSAAKKLNVTLDRLQQWESGQLKPTVSQLRKMVEVYKRPLAVFYLSSPPKGFTVMRDFRTLPDQEEAPVSPGLTYEIRRAWERREVALDLAQQLGEAVPALGLRASPRDNPDQAATRIRNRLGVSLAEQFRWRDPYEALTAWKNATEAAGILVFQTRRTPIEEARGVSISEDKLPAIILNGQDTTRGKIFTLAHELTHIVLHAGGICDLEDYRRAADSIEVFCNRVAGAVLVPAEALVQEIGGRRQEQWPDEEMERLAYKFSVSNEAILRRLVIIGAAPESFYQWKRKELLEAYARHRENEKLRRKETGGHPPYFRLALRNNGTRYTRLVFNAYYEDAISIRDVSDYLGVRLKHLGALERAVFHTLPRGE